MTRAYIDMAEYPPSTTISVPVTKLPAFFEARRSVAPTSSPFSPNRSMGVWCMMFATRLGVSILRFCSAGKKTRHQHVDSDLVGSPLAGEVLRQVVHGCFGGRVDEDVRQRV